MIKRCTSTIEDNWLPMRKALWPQCPRESHLSEMEMWCSDKDRYAAFLAYAESGRAIGFAEASIRVDHVNGTDSSPVGFLEGLYVDPGYRHKGMARKLVAAVEGWVSSRGCHELASDTDLDNNASRDTHKSLGFEETELVVFFRKRLGHGAVR